MCTLLVWRASPHGGGLVVAANRDELLSRPWSPPRLERGRRLVVMPRDDQGGGTWLGVNDRGLLAMVTNRMHLPMEPGRASRGLVCRAALDCETIDEAIAAAAAMCQADPRNPMNLLLAGAARAVLLSLDGEGGWRRQELPQGLSVITSRHDLVGAEGPVAAWRRRLELAVEARAASESVGGVLARALADHGEVDHGFPPCKHAEAYGTRSSALLVLSAQGSLELEFASGPPCLTPRRRVALEGLGG